MNRRKRMGHSHSVKQYPGQLALVAGIAAAVGASVALFVSPRSGKENRTALKLRAATVKGKVKRSPSKPADVVKSVTKQVSDKVNSAKRNDSMKPTTGSSGKIKSESDHASEQPKNGAKRNGRNSKDMTDEIRRNGEP
jgi:gas vesicle protein